jgi:hypothetical protein
MDRRSLLFAALALFFSVFLICAGLLQLRSWPFRMMGGALDQFTGALLSAAGLMAVLLAAARPRPLRRFVFWTGLCVALFALAIHEILYFHDQVRYTMADFGPPGALLVWAAVGMVAYLIHRMDRPSRTVDTALLAAFGFSTLWLASMGAGGLFVLPLPPQNLFFLEAYLSMLAFMFLLIALLVHYQDVFVAVARGARPRDQAQSPAPPVAAQQDRPRLRAA